MDEVSQLKCQLLNEASFDKPEALHTLLPHVVASSYSATLHL